LYLCAEGDEHIICFILDSKEFYLSPPAIVINYD
jgi:hypothetical protein